MKHMILMIFAVFLFIGGCNKEDKMEKQQISDTSKEVAIKFLKREYDIDFVVTDLDFKPAGVISVRGYDKADKDNSIDVQINQGDNYDVSSVGAKKDLPKPKNFEEDD